MSSQIHLGKVKFFDTDKCFGFIETSNNEEIYVHAGDLIDLIKKGDEVRFELQEDSGRKSACKVQRINKKR